LQERSKRLARQFGGVMQSMVGHVDLQRMQIPPIRQKTIVRKASLDAHIGEIAIDQRIHRKRPRT
jgi:hypothetical protein